MTPRAATSSQWFKARLFLPDTSSESSDSQGARRRQVKRPTLMTGVRDADRQPLDVRAEDQLDVDSPELGRATWRVIGDPAPLRKRRKVIGFQIVLERVKEPKADPL